MSFEAQKLLINNICLNHQYITSDRLIILDKNKSKFFGILSLKYIYIDIYAYVLHVY